MRQVVGGVESCLTNLQDQGAELNQGGGHMNQGSNHKSSLQQQNLHVKQGTLLHTTNEAEVRTEWALAVRNTSPHKIQAIVSLIFTHKQIDTTVSLMHTRLLIDTKYHEFSIKGILTNWTSHKQRLSPVWR